MTAVRSDFGKIAFLYYACWIWNNLPYKLHLETPPSYQTNARFSLFQTFRFLSKQQLLRLEAEANVQVPQSTILLTLARCWLQFTPIQKAFVSLLYYYINTKSIHFQPSVIMVLIAKFGPSNMCVGCHLGNYGSVNKIWRNIVALMSAVWVLIGSCVWQLTHMLLSLPPGFTESQTIVAIFL